MNIFFIYIPFTSVWIIRHHLENVKTVLDIGCGDGRLMNKVNKDKKYEVTGVDLYKPYLNKAKKTGVYKRLVKSDLRKLKFSSKSFDVVLASQVVEHLTKKDASKLINRLEDIAKHKVIITTPNGFVKYDPFDVKDNNKLQKHKSGWTIQEMEKLGYKIYGQGSKSVYRSEGPLYKFRRFKDIFVILSYLLSPITYFFPNKSFCIVAVKEL